MNQPLRLVTRILVCVACVTSVSTAGGALAFTDLTKARALTAVDRSSAKSDRISFNWAKDPALFAIPQSPLCPAQTSIRIVTDSEVLPEVALDCSK